MAISDLLNRVSKRRPDASRSAFAPSGPDRRVTPGSAPYGGMERRAADRRSAPRGPLDMASDAAASFAAGRPPLPSYAVLIIGLLTMLCLALAAALIVAVDAQSTPDDLGTTVEVSAPADAEPDDTPAPTDSFGAEAGVVPTDLLTRLEAASDGPLSTELNLLLEAIQIGFGQRSVQLEPTLRTYAYRTSSRFVWEPDTFAITVQAPESALAEARAATLSRLFETAIDEGRLEILTSVGPHSLSLASR